MDPTGTQTPQTPTTTGTIPVLREHIVSTPDTCGGKPRIAGSRIQVKHVAIMHERQGMTPEAIVSGLDVALDGLPRRDCRGHIEAMTSLGSASGASGVPRRHRRGHVEAVVTLLLSVPS
jgi:uncharacterized protein (DUF433 family)